MSQTSNTHLQVLIMDLIQILLILFQIILINSEECFNKSELCDFDYEKDLNLGFYEVPQISNYEKGGIYDLI